MKVLNKPIYNNLHFYIFQLLLCRKLWLHWERKKRKKKYCLFMKAFNTSNQLTEVNLQYCKILRDNFKPTRTRS